MRPIFRLSLILLALFLAIAPAMTLAQSAGTTGSSTTTTTTGPATGGSNSSNTNSSGTMTSPNNSTTTTSTTTSNVPWMWIIVGAIVVVGIVGIVAANGRNTTRIVS
jgi:cobalamin biosynthesis Mg chelatase CobN